MCSGEISASSRLVSWLKISRAGEIARRSPISSRLIANSCSSVQVVGRWITASWRPSISSSIASSTGKYASTIPSVIAYSTKSGPRLSRPAASPRSCCSVNGSQPGSWTVRRAAPLEHEVDLELGDRALVGHPEQDDVDGALDLGHPGALVALGDVRGDQRVQVEQARDGVHGNIGRRGDVDPDPRLGIRQDGLEGLDPLELAGRVVLPGAAPDQHPVAGVPADPARSPAVAGRSGAADDRELEVGIASCIGVDGSVRRRGGTARGRDGPGRPEHTPPIEEQ